MQTHILAPRVHMCAPGLETRLGLAHENRDATIVTRFCDVLVERSLAFSITLKFAWFSNVGAKEHMTIVVCCDGTQTNPPSKKPLSNWNGCAHNVPQHRFGCCVFAVFACACADWKAFHYSCPSIRRILDSTRPYTESTAKQPKKHTKQKEAALCRGASQ